MSSMSMKVVNCISKPPAERCDEEIELIWTWLAEKAEILKSKKPEIIKDIIRNCSYVKRFRDDVVIRQGDKGNSFYVILNGTVSVFINTEAVPDNPEEATVLVTEEAYTEETSSSGTKGKKELDRTRYGKCVVIFGPGKGFGELALISKDNVRNASIIADEEVDLLEVNRDLFNRCLKAAAEAEFQQKINFVNHCSLFNNWAWRYKRQAAMSLMKETFEYSKPLAVQGQPTDGLTFILSGQAVVVVDSLMHFSQYPDLHLHEDPDEYDKKEMMGNLLDPTADLSQHPKTPEGKKMLWEKPVCRQGYVIAEQRQAMKHIEVALVGPGEVVGDIEQGLGFETYAQSVICLVQTSVYILDGKNFERLVNPRRNFKTLIQLKNRAEQKLLSRVGRSLVSQIPLIRALVHRIMEEKNQEIRKEKVKEFQQLLPSSEVNAEGSEGNRHLLKETFEIQRGPVIDFYGPGTVFYRNKMKRLAKLKAQKAKDLSSVNAGGFGGSQRGGQGTFGLPQGQNDEASPPEPVMNMSAKDNRRVSPDKPPPIHQPHHMTIRDWETGAEHLSYLEVRIKHWHEEVDQMEQTITTPSGQPTPTYGKNKEAVFQLKRMHEAPPQTRLFPGKKIVFRPRHPREGSPRANQATAKATTSQVDQLFTTSLSSLKPTSLTSPLQNNMSTNSLPNVYNRSPTDKEVFITALRSTSTTRFQTPVGNSTTQIGGSGANAAALSSGVQQTPPNRGTQVKTTAALRVLPLNDIQDPRQLPYQNLQPLYRCRSANQTNTTVALAPSIDIKETFFAPLGRPENAGKRRRASRTGSGNSSRFNALMAVHPPQPSTHQPQYTLQEYLDLKDLLKKKERQFLANRLAMSV